ncbi:MAG: LysR family transcriptional regulator, partial [Bdellovibrionales bacterium]|nr:LysR family transcriptional regulator [Oligoflexia bacterium]
MDTLSYQWNDAPMDLNEIQYFKHVAECGSFTKASAQTKIPKSTLSRKVSDLEVRLGVSLFRRTTRQVVLTEVGQEYFRICQKAMAELEAGSILAGSEGAHPRGKLRIAAPLDIASTLIAGVTAEFCQKYPDIELEFLLDDRVVDLLEDKIDVAIRAGVMPDSSLKSQKLGSSEFQ